MKTFDPLHSLKVSGAWNGLTFYNYGDLTCARQTPIPVQPNTARQLDVRSKFTILSRVWSTDLTEGQRIAWSMFAKDFAWTDLWGREFVLKGIVLFAKINFQLIDAGKDLQITPPPAINPSEVVIKSIENAEGTVQIIIDPATKGEIASQSPFLDVWAIIDSRVYGFEHTPRPDLTLAGFWKPQGINPVKSDFRHRYYIDEIVEGEPPEPLDIVVNCGNHDANPFDIPTRVALLIRRFNKHGRYSTTQRVSLVSTVAP